MEKNQGFLPKVRSVADLAKMLEHSVLAPDASAREIVAGCHLALARGVGVMMVAPQWLALIVRELANSGVLPASVLAFPHGAALAEAKAHEAEKLALLGAAEIDMVINVGALKTGDFDVVERDVAGVVAAAGASVRVKTILEISLLSDEEIVTACGICDRAGAAFVKTSTGFGRYGATAGAVALMRRSVRDHVGVKASGGIRTLTDALTMIDSGASRIGTSATERILDEMAEAMSSNHNAK